MKTKKKTELIFILSQGHSGSTLLDILLGSLPGVLSCGELTYLPQQIHWNNIRKPTLKMEEVCTCLNSFKACAFWGQVIAKLSNKVGYNIFEEPFRFNISLLREQKYLISSQQYKYKFSRYLYKKSHYCPV